MLISLRRPLAASIGFFVLAACCPLGSADESEISPAVVDTEDDSYARYYIDDASEETGDPEFLLAQTQPPDVTEARPSPPTPAPPTPTRRRRRTYRLPPMFGDFGGGGSQALVQLPAVALPTQTFVDNLNGVDLFVTNNNGMGNGANLNPAVVIDIFNANNGAIITSSTAAGTPPNEPSSYPVGDPRLTDPAIHGFAPPVVQGQGQLVYNNGTAAYVGPNPPGPVDNGEFWALEFNYTFVPDPVLVNIPSAGGVVRRVKVSENNGPIPQDRFIFNYNYFNNVIGGVGDVNRYTFGFEHTFLNESSSVQVMFPFASTLSADQVAGGVTAHDTEFGDLTVILKTLLIDGGDYVVAAGCGLSAPTSDDVRVFDPTNRQIVGVTRDSVHVLPFLAMAKAYEGGLYWQGFLQLDVDSNGNPVQADVTGANLQPAGVLQDQTLLFLDFGVGYWLSDPQADTPAVAATAELHYVNTLQDADVVSASGLNITTVNNRFDVLNLTLGANVLVNESFSVRPAMVIPLSGNDDDQFDYEAMVQMNFWR